MWTCHAATGSSADSNSAHAEFHAMNETVVNLYEPKRAAAGSDAAAA
jgi:hypothetical protein